MVTFENFKDREEVLRKGKLSRNSNIHISEDISKRTRETRAELRKFMRKIKKSNPDATCFMQYDKLYVNNKIYVFNDLQGRVSVSCPVTQFSSNCCSISKTSAVKIDR